MPGAFQQSEATPAQQTWSDFQLAGAAPHSGDGHAMDRRAHRRHARTAPPGSDAVVDHERDVRDKVTGSRRGSMTGSRKEMGTVTCPYF